MVLRIGPVGHWATHQTAPDPQGAQAWWVWCGLQATLQHLITWTRLLATTTSDDDLPGDLQSLSWLTAVDVPRLQQMASGRVDLGGPSTPHPHPGALARAADLHVGATPGALLHGPAGMAPPGLLGLGPLASHGASMNQIPVGGQPSSGLQDPQQLYSPASQTQLPLPPGGQQCPPVGLYGSPFGARPPYPQPRMAVHSSQELHPKHYPKPIYSYSCLIAMALKNSKTGSLPVSEIYSFMKEHFPYFKTAPDGWKNSVRHNLSLNKCFEKVENKMSGSSRKGCLWALNVARIDKMEEEMHKWKRKDLAAIHRSMANPEELDKLISDRPESCRRPGNPETPVLTHATTVAMAHGCLAVSQLPPQPLMTLSLQSVPLHHQVQAQAHLAPDSPAPAQTPPLHALPELSPSPLPHPAMGRAPVDFSNIGSDMSTEVDSLDPSIMDFALQGNLWEEMKDGAFSLDTLGAFGDSPLGCELGAAGLTPASGGSDQSFPDLQVTGLYATYSTPDGVAASATSSSSQYLGAPGNKPIALL
ncbi:forkhead box protein N4 isoform X1 [Canis lupus familiaris]|uniref:forkhead box protein N4 isoform X1 n=1 Tax=Canis lupus familiaris TaxID=9615 RepID=UPI000BAA375E|nr:forkhead box protein N4 isoform X1 [Canis lupus familiaris]|eukprot:XP_022266219.1 forkhead box protein N4 isoform X1 [Canis lupus familiaris]